MALTQKCAALLLFCLLKVKVVYLKVNKFASNVKFYFVSSEFLDLTTDNVSVKYNADIKSQFSNI